MRIDISVTIYQPDENATNLLTHGHISGTNELLSVGVKEAGDLRCDGGMAQETGWERDWWDVSGILTARRWLLEARGDGCGWERRCAGSNVVNSQKKARQGGENKIFWIIIALVFLVGYSASAAHTVSQTLSDTTEANVIAEVVGHAVEDEMDAGR